MLEINKLNLLQKFLIVITLLFYIVYRFFFSMDSLPTGELLYSIDSPNNEYSANSYIVKGNATVANSIRVELIFNNKFKKSKNIFWQYREDDAQIFWIDNENISINNIILKVPNETYDFRKNEKKE